MEKESKTGILKMALAAFVVVMLVVIFSCCTQFLGLKDDSPLEESLEELVEGYTGLDVDLTPESPE